MHAMRRVIHLLSPAYMDTQIQSIAVPSRTHFNTNSPARTGQRQHLPNGLLRDTLYVKRTAVDAIAPNVPGARRIATMEILRPPNGRSSATVEPGVRRQTRPTSGTRGS